MSEAKELVLDFDPRYRRKCLFFTTSHYNGYDEDNCVLDAYNGSEIACGTPECPFNKYEAVVIRRKEAADELRR